MTSRKEFTRKQGQRPLLEDKWVLSLFRFLVFCTWAFADIQRNLAHLFFRGNYPWVTKKGVTLACCTDGFRPVIFKIERIED